MFDTIFIFVSEIIATCIVCRVVGVFVFYLSDRRLLHLTSNAVRFAVFSVDMCKE